MKLLVVQELPEHGYTGTITKDSFEEEVRGSASADDLAALLVKGSKREALLEIEDLGLRECAEHEDQPSEGTLAGPPGVTIWKTGNRVRGKRGTGGYGDFHSGNREKKDEGGGRSK